MTRLLTLVALSLAMAFAPAPGEARAKRVHITVEIVQQTFTGDGANPKLGDQLITSVKLSEDVSKVLISHQMARPNSYRLMKSPITR